MSGKDIDGELDTDEPVRMHVPPALLAKLESDEKVAAARLAAEAAQKAAKAAQDAVEEALLRAAEAAEGLRDAEEQAVAEAEAAARAAHDAKRPERVEWEIEVVEVRNESRTVKAVEFIVHGAPNLASYKGAPPALCAYISMVPGRQWARDPHTYYPFDERESESVPLFGPGKAKGRAEGPYRTAALVRSERPERPQVHIPRTAHLDGYFARLEPAPGVLTDEIVEAACRRVLAEHLDMVDAERLRRGDSADVDRSFMGKRLTVRS